METMIFHDVNGSTVLTGIMVSMEIQVSAESSPYYYS
jgi:hypothetical protein